MSKKAELQDALKNTYEEMKALRETAQNDGWSDDLSASFDALSETAENYAADIDAIEVAEERENRFKRFEDKLTQPVDRNLGNGTVRQSKSGEFAGLGDFAMAVVKAKVGNGVDPRLIQNNGLGHNEGVPADGGFFVGADMATELLDKSFGMGTVLSRVRRTPISSGSNQLKVRKFVEDSRADGSRHGGVRAYWEGEASTLTKSQMEFETEEIYLRKLTALTYATEELLQDATALEAIIREGFENEMTFVLEDAIFRGDGVGKPEGILNASAKVEVAKESGQSADTVVFENIVKMWARLHPRNKQNAVWYVDPSVVPELQRMALEISTAGGTAAYLPPGGLSASPYGSLMGRPVIESEYCNAVGDAGDIVLVDLNGYRWIDKGGVRMDTSMHVQFLTDEMAFRWIYRANGHNIINTALTPRSGSASLTNIVTLAERA